MKPQILYVDDEQINLNVFKLNFKKHFNIITAENGHDGLSMLKKHPETRVVLSDMKMPNMNGIEFINKAKELFPSIHYYIITGLETTPEIEHGLKSGMIKKYFNKPFEVKELIEELKQVTL